MFFFWKAVEFGILVSLDLLMIDWEVDWVDRFLACFQGL